MTTVAVSLAVLVVVLIAAVAFVGWRDRQRLASREDPAVARDAAATQAQGAAERHGAQGAVWQSGQTPGM
jgi:hypothetical protein